MKLNLFSAWATFALVLVSIVALAGFLVAAGSGFGGWAVLTGVICLGSVAAAAVLLGTTRHHDHRLHRPTPSIF